jgi:hypothetical protein
MLTPSMARGFVGHPPFTFFTKKNGKELIGLKSNNKDAQCGLRKEFGSQVMGSSIIVTQL